MFHIFLHTMQVTYDNFREALPLLRSSIMSADFIAFDFELSGLYTHKDLQQHQLDSVQQIYTKTRKSAQR